MPSIRHYSQLAATKLKVTLVYLEKNDKAWILKNYSLRNQMCPFQDCSERTNSFLSWFHLRILAGGGSFHRTIAVTDFEPTEARMAFPCFDEPLFKANFSIKIRRESRHIALSNMPKVLPLTETLGNYSPVEPLSLLCCFKNIFFFFSRLTVFICFIVHVI